MRMSFAASCCRFNAATAATPWRTQTAAQAAGDVMTASMRPRRRRRGEPLLAEPGTMFGGWLQCGHGGDAVENPDRGGVLAPNPLSFNAATAATPWRTGSHRGGLAPVNVLQCGHGGDAVENSDGAGNDAVAAHGFNAATAATPWRT